MDFTQWFQLVAMFLSSVAFASAITSAPAFYPNEGGRFGVTVSLAGLNLFLLVLNTVFFAASLVGGQG